MSICGLILLSWGFWGWFLLVCVVFSLASSLGIMLYVIHARKRYIVDLGFLDVLFMIEEILKYHLEQVIKAVIRIPATRSGVFTVGCILGLILGWSGRDLLQFKNTHTLHDVRITQKQDDKNYHMTFIAQPEGEFRVPLCSGRPFFVGLQFHVFIYEDKGSCWFIEWTDNTKLGYLMYDTLYQEKEDGKQAERTLGYRPELEMVSHESWRERLAREMGLVRSRRNEASDPTRSTSSLTRKDLQ